MWAVTGSIGSGKSTTLEQLATKVRSIHIVDGFLQRARGDRQEGRGAAAYDLYWLLEDSTTPFAERKEKGYAFNPLAQKLADEKSKEFIGTNHLIILDEFGRLEANGGGHLESLKNALLASPGLIVLGVRKDALADIQQAAGIEFNRVFDLDEPNQGEQFLQEATDYLDWRAVASWGFYCGLAETTLGTTVHALPVPLLFWIMPMQQTSMLTYATGRLVDVSRSFHVALIATGFKAMAPGPSKIRPMFAITIQGYLYSLANKVLGFSRWGATVGGILVGAWAGLQGYLLQLLLTGSKLGTAYGSIIQFLKKEGLVAAPSLTAVIGTMVALNAMAGGLAGYRSAMKVGFGLPPKVRSGILGGKVPSAVAEFLRTSFWLPVVLIAGLAGIAEHSWQSAAATLVRAVLVALALGSLVRWIDFGRLFRRFSKGKNAGLADAWEEALARVEKKN